MQKKIKKYNKTGRILLYYIFRLECQLFSSTKGNRALTANARKRLSLM